jgi:hypothetical protein
MRAELVSKSAFKIGTSGVERTSDDVDGKGRVSRAGPGQQGWKLDHEILCEWHLPNAEIGAGAGQAVTAGEPAEAHDA